MSNGVASDAENFNCKYTIGETLGRGAFGLVKKCYDKVTKNAFAVKLVNSESLSSNHIQMLEREAKICGKLKHINIVRLHGFYSNDGVRQMVFDLVTGGELFEEIVKRDHYSEADASHCIEQVIQALGYCHKNGVIHRDVKPENILLASKENGAIVKLADFGLAVEVSGDKQCKYGLAGSPSYIAPEILERNKYGKAVDMWSCGVILYILLSGSPPFKGASQKELFQAIRDGSFEFPSSEWRGVTVNAKSLVRSMLEVDPTERFTAEEALSHRWIKTRELSASHVHRVETLENLRQFNARRKLKGAILTTIFATKNLSLG